MSAVAATSSSCFYCPLPARRHGPVELSNDTEIEKKKKKAKLNQIGTIHFESYHHAPTDEPIS